MPITPKQDPYSGLVILSSEEEIRKLNATKTKLWDRHDRKVGVWSTVQRVFSVKS